VLVLYIVETLIVISVAVFIKTVFGMNFESFHFGSNEPIVFILLFILTWQLVLSVWGLIYILFWTYEFVCDMFYIQPYGERTRLMKWKWMNEWMNSSVIGVTTILSIWSSLQQCQNLLLKCDYKNISFLNESATLSLFFGSSTFLYKYTFCVKEITKIKKKNWKYYTTIID
jgi:hypothetical protein